MISTELLEDLCCPQSLVRSEVVDLVVTDNGLRSELDTYPIISEVPDLRFPSDREGTSYDNILAECKVDLYDDAALLRMAKAMEIQKSDIEGKKILIAGVGGGTELDMILNFGPRIIYALDFSSFIIHLSKRPKYKNSIVRFIVGDLCNIPFKPDIFDYVISGGVVQATRSPELAHRNIWRTIKRGGRLNYASIYLENIHNTRVSIDRLRKKYHQMDPELANHRLLRYAKLYTFLRNYNLLRFINRTRFRIPFILELSGAKGKNVTYHHATATDYYMCRYRHMIPQEDVFDWFTKVGGDVHRTPKGYLGTKI